MIRTVIIKSNTSREAILDCESLTHVDFYSFVCYSCVAPSFSLEWNKEVLDLIFHSIVPYGWKSP